MEVKMLNIENIKKVFVDKEAIDGGNFTKVWINGDININVTDELTVTKGIYLPINNTSSLEILKLPENLQKELLDVYNKIENYLTSDNSNK